MQLTRALLAAVAITSAHACGVAPVSLPRSPARLFARADAKMYKLEIAPGEVIEVTEEEKFQMMDQRTHFFDITEWAEAPNSMLSNIEKRAVLPFPGNLTHKCNVTTLAKKLNMDNVRANIERMSSFHNRYYLSNYGIQSTEWLFNQIKAVVDQSGNPHASVRYVQNVAWGQPSIIATLPGQTARTIVAGAHLDSIISGDRGQGRAPGADDDASGSTMLIEVLRVFLTDPRVAAGQLLNTLEFQWYSAEEAGLLGSQNIFTQYAEFKRQVVAMLQQDMVGYLGRDGVERFGVVTDFVDADLTAFMRKLIEEYTTIPWEDTVCGYACSDHASATRSGYPSSFIFETPFGNHNPYIHTPNDTIEKISFDHISQHAKMTLGYFYELAWWNFI